MSGGGGNSSAPISQTVTTSSIPQWFQPTAESIIGAGMGNTFNMQQNPDGTMAPTSMIGFTPFGSATGQTDQAGNPILSGYGPSQQLAANAAVAGFTPLQQQAQQGISNLQMPSQFGTATDLATQAGQGAMNSAGIAYGYGNQGQASGLQGQQIGTEGGQRYGSMGASYGAQGAGLANQNIGVGQQGMQAGMSYGQNATNPNAVQSYMNPYLANTLNPALSIMDTQYGMQGAQEQGAATSAGAFGGSREALMSGLNQSNRMLAENQLVSNAYNQAYNTANTNMQAASQLGMQGAQTGLQGLQGANTAYNTGIQGANTGLQGVNTQLAGTAQGMQGAQVGLQGVNAAQAGYGLSGQQATNLANIGNQQLQAQEGIYGLQNQTGAQQQQQYQNVLNQAIQNYSNQQQYPQTQLANLMNLGRSTPTQSTQVNYQAPPSAVSQIAGLGTAGIAGLGLYNTMNKGATG